MSRAKEARAPKKHHLRRAAEFYQRMADRAEGGEREAAQYQADFATLAACYWDLGAVLGKRPPAAILDPTERAEWLDLCRDIARRAWSEVQSVQPYVDHEPTPRLRLIKGGAA